MLKAQLCFPGSPKELESPPESQPAVFSPGGLWPQVHPYQACPSSGTSSHRQVWMHSSHPEGRRWRRTQGCTSPPVSSRTYSLPAGNPDAQPEALGVTGLTSAPRPHPTSSFPDGRGSSSSGMGRTKPFSGVYVPSFKEPRALRPRGSPENKCV